MPYRAHQGDFVLRFFVKRRLFLEMSGLLLIFVHLLQWMGRTGMEVSSGDHGTQHPKPPCSKSHYVLSPCGCMKKTMELYNAVLLL